MLRYRGGASQKRGEIVPFFNKPKKTGNCIQSKEIKNTIKKFNKLLKLNIKSKIHVKQISDNVVEIEA